MTVWRSSPLISAAPFKPLETVLAEMPSCLAISLIVTMYPHIPEKTVEGKYRRRPETIKSPAGETCRAFDCVKGEFFRNC